MNNIKSQIDETYGKKYFLHFLNEVFLDLK